VKLSNPTFEGMIDLEHIKLFVRQFGEKGPDVIVIHGGPDWDQSYLLPIVPYLETSAKLTFFDIRACGKSERTESISSLTKSDIVDDISCLVEKLEISNPIILGFSFGGRVAIKYAKEHPETIQAMILASTTVYDDFQQDLDSWEEYKARNDSSRKEANRSLLNDQRLSYRERSERYIRGNLDLDVYLEGSLSKASESIDSMVSPGFWLEAWNKGYMNQDKKFDQIAELKSFKFPVLVLHGEKDMRFPVTVAKKLKDEIPEIEIEIIPQTGHLSHIESPEKWNSAVLKFIERM